jgi:hypothetical protein
MPRKPTPFWDRVDTTGDCWLWTGCRNKDGYGLLRYQGVMVTAHVRAWVLTNGRITDGMHVLHHCDNPPCCNPSHLFLGTNHDNVLDRHRKGRSKNLFCSGHAVNQGSRCRKAKLSEADIPVIRSLLRDGVPQADIAKRYGVHRSQISRIKNRRYWSHV